MFQVFVIDKRKKAFGIFSTLQKAQEAVEANFFNDMGELNVIRAYIMEFELDVENSGKKICFINEHDTWENYG